MFTSLQRLWLYKQQQKSELLLLDLIVNFKNISVSKLSTIISFSSVFTQEEKRYTRQKSSEEIIKTLKDESCVHSTSGWRSHSFLVYTISIKLNSLLQIVPRWQIACSVLPSDDITSISTSYWDKPVSSLGTSHCHLDSSRLEFWKSTGRILLKTHSHPTPNVDIMVWALKVGLLIKESFLSDFL